MSLIERNKDGLAVDQHGNPIEITGQLPIAAESPGGVMAGPTPEQIAHHKLIGECYQRCAKVRERNQMLDGIAMSALVAMAATDVRNDTPTPPDALARRAYKVAAAMLTERQNHLQHEPDPPPGIESAEMGVVLPVRSP